MRGREMRMWRSGMGVLVVVLVILALLSPLAVWLCSGIRARVLVPALVSGRRRLRPLDPRLRVVRADGGDVGGGSGRGSEGKRGGREGREGERREGERRGEGGEMDSERLILVHTPENPHRAALAPIVVFLFLVALSS